MEKDFDGWNEQKKKVEIHKDRPFFFTSEVWFAKLGLNIGFEQDGKGVDAMRPIVVLRKFSNSALLCVPTTKTEKIGEYYFRLSLPKGDTTAILTQIRFIDAKRLVFKIGLVKRAEFHEMKKRIISLLK